VNSFENQDANNMPFIGTYKEGKVVGPCWKFLNNEHFLTGTCSGLETVSVYVDKKMYECIQHTRIPILRFKFYE